MLPFSGGHLGPLLLLFFIQILLTNAVDKFQSPFTARPLRIRLVNYERQFLPPKHVATPDDADRIVAPHAHNMPQHQSTSFASMQQNDEPIQSYASRSQFAGGSYLQEVRKRMRVGGAKIHSPATSLAIPNISSETSDPNSRRLSPVNDVKRLFDNDIEPSENRTRVVATRRFIAQTTTSPTNPTVRSSSDAPTTAISQTNTVSTTEPSTTPVKVRPVLPRDDIFPIDEQTEKQKTENFLSELEIKSDLTLQKSLQRTTLRTETYTERPNVAKSKSFTQATSPSPTPAVFTLPTLFPTLPDHGPLGIQNVPSIANGTLGAGFPSPFVASQLSLQPQQQQTAQQAPSDRRASRPSDPNATLEQLGCGFDLLTQSCKDVFGLGWCAQCTDLGNVFLHDCKCAAATPLGRTANAIFTNPTTPIPAHTVANSFLPTQPSANTWTRN